MNVKFIINWYASTGDGTWEVSPTVITDAYDVKVTSAMGKTQDTAQFKLQNPRNTNTSVYGIQDKVDVYLSIDGTVASDSTLLLTGLIKNITETVSSRGRMFTIDVVSFSEVTGNALIFGDTGTSHSMDVMEFLQNCLSSVANRNGNFNVTWNPSNPTTKNNGDAFPVLNSGNQIKEYDKSLSDVLDRYLSNDFTEDGNYYWYVNNANLLTIGKRLIGTPIGTLVEGTDITEAKYTYDISDVKNYVIVKCGIDLNDRPISAKVDDAVSRAKYGFKYYMIVDKTIAEKVRIAGGYTSGGDNDAFREEVKALGRARGLKFIGDHNIGSISATLSLPPTLTYSIGQRVSLTSDSYGLSAKLLRVKEVHWDVDSTTLVLVEEIAA